ncbi:MAG: hypothetical protein NXI16_04455 [Alphaproteobacteria bacterium]|nr:hypothetical protein [Alphaproteobacteria bacterium]
MRPQRYRIAIASILSGLSFWANPAQAADVLTAENFAAFCGEDPQPGTVADIEKIAEWIVDQATRPIGLERRLELLRAGLARAEDAGYADTPFMYMVGPASKNDDDNDTIGKPFGDFGDDTAKRDLANAAAHQIAKLRNDVLDELESYHQAPQPRYKASEEPGFNARRLFETDSGITIECFQDHAASRAGTDGGSLFDGAFRLTKTVDDLTKMGSDGTREGAFSDIKPAEISFIEDIENDGSDFGIDATAGIVINADGGRLLPYVQYKHLEAAGASTSADIHTLAPGFEYRGRRVGNRVAATLGFGAKAVLDLEQDSRQFVGNASLTPTIQIGKRRLFGEPLRVGSVFFRPDLTLVGKAAGVLDAGSNVDLQTVDGYLAVGGLASVSITLPGVRVVQDFTAQASFNHLQYVAGGLNRDNANRLDAALSYQFPDYRNLSLSFAYSNGEDLDTFLEEESYRLVLGLKF